MADQKNPVSIHFEQVLLFRTPITTKSKVAGTISRLASISHGTTVNTQGIELPGTILNAPVIPKASIVPFNVRQDPLTSQVNVFPNLTFNANATTTDNFRIPADLSKSNATGVITANIFNNPKKILDDLNEKKKVQNHFTLTLSTKSTADCLGRGTFNIGFLSARDIGQGSTSRTANAFAMTCQYQVSTVAHEVVISLNDQDKRNKVMVFDTEEGKKHVPAPKLQITLNEKVSASTTIQPTFIQVQYSQNVTMDFGTLSWAHILVATLIPSYLTPLVAGSNSHFLKDLRQMQQEEVQCLAYQLSCMARKVQQSKLEQWLQRSLVAFSHGTLLDEHAKLFRKTIGPSSTC